MLLIQLSETDKRVLFALLIIFILLVVIIAYIGYLINVVMKRQGKRIEHYVSDVVYTRVITDPKHFKQYARKKNWQIFYKRSKWPIFLVAIAGILLLVYEFIKGFNYNPFSSVDGFGTLLFSWDFGDPDLYQEFFGVKLISKWPALSNTPHFVAEAWCGYIFVPLFLTGVIWYLGCVQALIARYLHINKLSDSIFSKNLENFNQNAQLYNSLNPNQLGPQQQPQQPQNNPNENPPDGGNSQYRL